jgi:hypothetical protein
LRLARRIEVHNAEPSFQVAFDQQRGDEADVIVEVARVVLVPVR